MTAVILKHMSRIGATVQQAIDHAQAACLFDTVSDRRPHARSPFTGGAAGVVFGARSMLARAKGGNGKQDGSRIRDRLAARRRTFSQLAGAQ